MRFRLPSTCGADTPSGDTSRMWSGKGAVAAGCFFACAVVPVDVGSGVKAGWRPASAVVTDRSPSEAGGSANNSQTTSPPLAVRRKAGTKSGRSFIQRHSLSLAFPDNTGCPRAFRVPIAHRYGLVPCLNRVSASPVLQRTVQKRDRFPPRGLSVAALLSSVPTGRRRQAG